MSYDIIGHKELWVWWEKVSNPLVVVPKSRIDLYWSIMGQIGPSKKQNDLFLSSFQLDCHQEEDSCPKLGNS